MSDESKALTKQHNAALAHILALYAENATPDPETVKAQLALLKPPKASKLVKVAKGKRVPTEGGVVPSALDGIKVGSLDAAGFIAALRVAGFVPKVLENGTTIQVPSGDKDRIRADQRNALAAFVGFTTEPIGVQVSNATRKAQYMLRPSVGSDRRTADPTLSGYVAGMPDHLAKQIEDLAGRETLAAENLASYEKQAREANAQGDEDMCNLYKGLAHLEEARIAEIRKDLAKLA